jgi:hypothetical protein
MAMKPEDFLRRRDALIRVVKNSLEEAIYANGQPVRINDYYKVPGSDSLALSKRGAEKLGDLYRFKILKSEIVDHKCEKDYCYARARVTLHRAGQVVAEREGSASSAEKAFQNSAAKYGKDFRAADNDIIAKAQKRAYVQGLIAALSATEILAAADDYEGIPSGEAEVVDERPTTLPPEMWHRIATVLTKAQQVGAISQEDSSKFLTWAEKPGRTAEKLEDQLVALEDKIAASEEGPFK